MIRELVVAGVKDAQSASAIKWTKRAKVDFVRGIVGPKLHPSGLGVCKRQVVLKAVEEFPDHPAHRPVTRPFGIYTLCLFEAGKASEDYHRDYVQTQLSETIANPAFVEGYWSFELDLLLEPYVYERARSGMIIEFKETEGHNFRRKNGLPYDHHLCQLGAYSWLLQSRYSGHRAALYYNSRMAKWAEFEIYVSPDGVLTWQGEVNGRYREGGLDHDFLAEMTMLQEHMRSETLPGPLDTPTDHPWACSRRAGKDHRKPACKWFDHCWSWEGDWPDRDLFSEDDLMMLPEEIHAF